MEAAHRGHGHKGLVILRLIAGLLYIVCAIGASLCSPSARSPYGADLSEQQESLDMGSHTESPSHSSLQYGNMF